MSAPLQTTLDQLVGQGSGTNPAFDVVLRDYAWFHMVLALLAAAFLFVAAAIAVMAWRGFRRAKGSDRQGRTFRRLTHLAALVVSGGLALVLGLLVAANVTTALEPREGFKGSIGMIGTPAAGTRAGELHQAFDDWLRSGDPHMPRTVQHAVDDRLAWQRPKAVICTVLLIVVAALAVRIWRSLLRRTSEPGHRWRAGDLARLGAGLGSVLAAVLLMLMVMGNTQASLAPVAMTLFFG